MRRRKLNTKRRTGRFEFWQVRQRYHDGSPYEDGSLVLWVRSVGRNSAKGGQRSGHRLCDPHGVGPAPR
jgi:hypothetical protein